MSEPIDIKFTIDRLAERIRKMIADTNQKEMYIIAPDELDSFSQVAAIFEVSPIQIKIERVVGSVIRIYK